MTPLVLGAATALAAANAAQVQQARHEGCVESVAELPEAPHVDPSDRRLTRRHLLVAHKSARRLMLFDRGTLTACYRVGLGFSPEGDKKIEGDGKTPVGWYPTSDKPWSVFDGAIAIHYPNVADAEAGLADGTISRRQRDDIVDKSRLRAVPPQRTPMGGAVLIHGGGSSADWTLGCIALEDSDLADLRARMPRSMKTDLLVIE